MSEFVYPQALDIRPLHHPAKLTLRVPGSKSITNRALILAALSGDCAVTNALRSEDTEVMVDSLQKLRYLVETDWPVNRISVKSTADSLKKDAELFIGNSGTSMRFLTALCSLGQGRFRLDGIARMRERPIQDLLDCLKQLNVDAVSETQSGCPPVLLNARGLKGGHAKLNAELSSQFVSALLMVLPFAQGDSILELEGEIVSEPYIQMTVAMLQQNGIQIDTSTSGRFGIPGNQKLNCQVIDVEPDASSASYFFAAAAITGGTVRVEGLNEQSLQGDIKFADALAEMGCQVEKDPAGITVTGGKLHGIDIDMNAISDTVMTLAVVACYADKETEIRNVEHIRHKETDRIEAIGNELRRAGVEVEIWKEGLTIYPVEKFRATRFNTYNDHRMAMSLALLGLRSPGMRIKNPGCVAKTYPGFWQDFEKLYTE
ncbi:3-phosphoshikimate 1-carboxyvinyltransferase [Telmatocola sphagniphila]|uniref:3-phosphoshikimate 1-carboxyvinyltransferase n=1 Tax=Telmatocola sphagniphila TaxID=1123043 RepID=A0A8E6B2K5_9BACT|nr:3-phosphoshikimate 1-carboxyvinyltransferase [Telmatocola sphagniphila]QVL30672.1 3-phosphoshikimate 1-carboxyvinyltransferase [Telmatocola sphagniphila]